jgi:uncharacterized repeat protein (TIGR03803 family)
MGGWKSTCAVLLLCAVTAIAAPAQTFNRLVSFDGSDGSFPLGSLVQGLDGSLYGTTYYGGNLIPCLNGCGTVFKITAGGALTTLYSFCSLANCPDGLNPYAGLIQATDGNLYGTTLNGGSSCSNCYFAGTAFRITPGGTLTTLYSFCPLANGFCPDGATPYSGVVQATDGNFYGTTELGGTNCPNNSGCGTVFKITPEGTLTTLHSFAGYPTEGSTPESGLIQGTHGNFYGTTYFGGTNSNCGPSGCGTVFRITPGGTLTTLYTFCAQTQCTDGSAPSAGLVQGADGDFYGTTTSYDGTVFKITSAGTLTTLYSFDSTDGADPIGRLVQGTDGSFYGTTAGGGAKNRGTIFRITSGGALTTLHTFDGTHGRTPYAGLVQATSGTFYGTTAQGGSNNYCSDACGTVFSLAVGLGPFVETLPTVGKIGAKVAILGTGLTGATSVTFNGTVAAFTVVSSSEIQTTVPSGATSGEVQVTTPHGTLSSNVAFRVKQ